MDLPSVTIQDVGFSCDIGDSNSAQSQDLRIAQSSSNETLIINKQSVYWYRGSIISRKLLYETDVINAFFATFNSKPNDLEKEQVLVVILISSAHIYYKDGRSYLTSFPFNIRNALQYENGVIIEREGAHINNQFFTITEPMNELGSIVSSSTSSISADEKLIYFPQSSSTSIAVTFNEIENTISFHHTRFLNRPINANLNGSIQRKQSHLIRRTSINKNTGGNNGTGGTFGKESGDGSTGDFNGDEIKIDGKRSVSHSEALSIDRMVSYDFGAKSGQTSNTFSSVDSSTLRRDAILTRFETIKFEIKNNAKDIMVSSLSSNNKEAIVVKNASVNLFEIILFEKSGSGRFTTPQVIRSMDVSAKFLDATVSSQLPGFLIMISTDNRFVLYNPFNQISSSVYQPQDTISQLFVNSGSQLIVKNSLGQVHSYHFMVNPKSEAIEKALSSFRFLVGSDAYNCIRVIWFNAFAIVHKDWEALILTVLVIVLPFAVNPSIITTNNAVCRLLPLVGPLQLRALEDDLQLHEMAPNFVLALHLIREEYRMNVLQSKIVDDLGLVLAQITLWMQWGESWYGYYRTEEPLDNGLKFATLQILQSPPDVIQSLCSLFETNIVPYCTFSRLTQESEKVDELVTPRTFYVLRLFEAIVSPEFSFADVVNMVAEFNITQSTLETYPIGIVVPIREAISFVEKKLTSLNQGVGKFDLVDRQDLKRLGSSEPVTFSSSGSSSQAYQPKDIHQVITSIQDPPEPLAPLEKDRFNITKLIFSEDRRFYEISKILQTFQNQIIFSEDIVNLEEQEMLKMQKDLASSVALRTLSIPLGRSMLFYSSKVPLATERFLFPKLNFNALIQPENVTVSLERSSISNNALQWGYFHNGAASGLTVSKNSKGISGSWIIFNKPENLTAQHGGFLLGLGLNGHLKSLEEWNIYNYLGPKHFFTSVGLLLGMSASLRGTMDVKLTKVLSVHVVALLPQGASDLIISTQVQAAGLIGIGLLYLETQHRRMSEILLSQINGNVIVEEKELSDESYRLSAGIGLGYVNLGKGDDLRGLHDTHAVDELISMATPMKDVQNKEGYDKSIAGAIIALSFIYMKTNNDIIAKKLDIPDNQQLLDYIRPDLLLLRLLGKNLVLWDKIEASNSWIESQIPEILSADQNSSDNLLNPGHHYVISGLCLSIGLKFASSQDLVARDTLIGYYDSVTDLLNNTDHSTNYAVRLTKQALTQCQTILAFSMSLIMAASGDLEVFRRLRILHGRVSQTDKNEIYGKYMAVNMALGFLFLGGGQHAFNTSSNFAIAALVTSLYPLFPKTESIEPDVHLQALRHFWSLSVEPRCLVVRDVESSKPIKSEVVIEYYNGFSQSLRTPCLLPPLDTVKKIVSATEDYFKLVIDDLSKFNDNIEIFVYKRKRVEVLKQPVKLILKEINAKFDEDAVNLKDEFADLNIFQDMKKVDVSKLLNENTGLQSNILERQIELNHIVQSPTSVSELWNLKLVFSFYDRLLSEEDVSYLSMDYVEDLKNKLMARFR